MANRADQKSDALEAALGAWRSRGADSPRFSAESRERILSSAFHSVERPVRQRGLFFPLGRVLAATLPMFLAVALLGVLTHDSGPVRETGPVSVHASKAGGQVVFTLANGGRTHVVRKSDSPDGFDQNRGTKVRGEFSDSIEGSSGIVYYRID